MTIKFPRGVAWLHMHDGSNHFCQLHRANTMIIRVQPKLIADSECVIFGKRVQKQRDLAYAFILSLLTLDVPVSLRNIYECASPLLTRDYLFHSRARVSGETSLTSGRLIAALKFYVVIYDN